MFVKTEELIKFLQKHPGKEVLVDVVRFGRDGSGPYRIPYDLADKPIVTAKYNDADPHNKAGAIFLRPNFGKKGPTIEHDEIISRQILQEVEG